MTLHKHYNIQVCTWAIDSSSDFDPENECELDYRAAAAREIPLDDLFCQHRDKAVEAVFRVLGLRYDVFEGLLWATKKRPLEEAMPSTQERGTKREREHLRRHDERPVKRERL